MSDLPYSDPSNPALPSPLFSDVTAVRGDHMRANNAAIFADLIELNTRNPELVALTTGSFKTAALANANTYNGRSFFTCTAGVSDTPGAGAWRIIGYWNPTDSTGRFVAMADTSLETWEINYSGAAWGAWTKLTGATGNITRDVTGNLTGDVTGNVTGNASGSSGSCTGNAATADGVKETGAGVVLKSKLINIGDWDMNSTTSKAVAHGCTLSKILFISVMIRNDDDSARYPLTIQPNYAYNPSGAYVSIDGTNINMMRRPTGTFDNTDFNATSYNRGFIYILYTD